MALEIMSEREPLTRLQRWSHYLTVLVLLLAFIYGLNIRDTLVSATRTYTNIQAGISVRYPVNWLIDENDNASYIFRVRDMTRIGFKTTIQIAVEPVGPDASPQSILNSLALQRSTQLAQYNTLSIEGTNDIDNSESFRMTYYFTTSDVDAILETLPVVVIGQDVLTIVEGQAVVVTLRADAATFDEDLQVFERFLETLEFR